MEKNKFLNNNFILLCFGTLTSKIGTIIYNLALSWWLINEMGTARYVGYITAASLISPALIGPFSGVITDRFNKKYIMVVTDIIAGSASIIIGILLHLNLLNIFHLVIVGFLIGSCYTLFRPASKSIIPEIVSKEYLVRSNSLLSNINEIAKVVGPAVGAMLLGISYISIKGIFIINGLTYFISALSEILIKYEYIKVDNKVNILDSFKQGAKYTYNNTLIRNTIILCSIVNFFYTSLSLLMPLYVIEVLKESSSFYSFTLTSEAAGGIIITLIVLALPDFKPSRKLMSFSLIMTGVFLASISLIPSKIIAIGGVFFVGVSLGLFNTVFTSYIQDKIDSNYMGRVFSILFMISTLFMPLGNIFFGFVGDYVLNKVFTFSGIAIILASFIYVYSTRIDNIEKEDSMSNGYL